jgi:hypothetical protein
MLAVTTAHPGSSHYRIQDLCRVSGTLGKAKKTLGKSFAERNTGQSALGSEYSGKDVFAECLLSGTRQRLCRVSWKALGKEK